MNKFFAAFVLLFSVSAFSSDDVTITEIPVPLEHVQYFQQMMTENQQIVPMRQGIDEWVGVGRAVWEMITSFGGTMKVEAMTGVGVVPQAAGSISNLTNWQTKQPKSYRMIIKGTVGTAFTFDYTVGFNYAGQFKRSGKFLGNVAILPFNAKCGWSWNCELNANVGEAINVGTNDAPIASLPVTLIVNAKGKLNSKAAGVHFSVYGDGRLEQVLSEVQ